MTRRKRCPGRRGPPPHEGPPPPVIDKDAFRDGFGRLEKLVSALPVEWVESFQSLRLVLQDATKKARGRSIYRYYYKRRLPSHLTSAQRETSKINLIKCAALWTRAEEFWQRKAAEAASENDKREALRLVKLASVESQKKLSQFKYLEMEDDTSEPSESSNHPSEDLTDGAVPTGDGIDAHLADMNLDRLTGEECISEVIDNDLDKNKLTLDYQRRTLDETFRCLELPHILKIYPRVFRELKNDHRLYTKSSKERRALLLQGSCLSSKSDRKEELLHELTSVETEMSSFVARLGHLRAKMEESQGKVAQKQVTKRIQKSQNRKGKKRAQRIRRIATVTSADSALHDAGTNLRSNLDLPLRPSYDSRMILANSFNENSHHFDENLPFFAITSRTRERITPEPREGIQDDTLTEGGVRVVGQRAKTA